MFSVLSQGATYLLKLNEQNLNKKGVGYLDSGIPA